MDPVVNEGDCLKNSIDYLDGECFASLKKLKIACDKNMSKEIFRNRDSPADKSLLACDGKEIYLDKIKKPLQSAFNVKVGSALFNCFLHQKKSPYLYVFLRAWRSKTGPNSPVVLFQRWSWYNKTNSSVFCINNPMLHEYQNMSAGWYLGGKEDYISHTAKLIIKIADLLSIPHNHIIVYGSSSGGTAAIHVSALIRGSLAVAINPQILPHVSKSLKADYEKNVGISLESLGERAKTIDIIKNGNNKNIIIVNRLADSDLAQVKLLSDRYNMELNYGLSKKDNLIVWVYEAVGFAPGYTGHHSLDYDPMFYAIDALAKMFINDVEIPQNLYALMTEFWRDHFLMLSQSRMNQLDNLATDSEEDRVKRYSEMRDNSKAYMQVGRAYRDGKGVEKNADEAIIWMRKATEIDPRWANEFVRTVIARGSDEDLKEAYNICFSLAETGYASAMGELGRMYRDGKGIDQDLSAAIKWMRMAAEKGVGWAKNELFDLLWKVNTEDSYKEMICVATEFARAGDGGAMARLGRAHREGKGVVKDLHKSSDWFRLAVENNIGWAKNELFEVLWRIGTPESFSEMISVIIPYAEAGNGNAMGLLGRAYREGKGVRKDHAIAIQWYNKAKDCGVLWAEKELAELELQQGGKD